MKFDVSYDEKGNVTQVIIVNKWGWRIQVQDEKLWIIVPTTYPDSVPVRFTTTKGQVPIDMSPDNGK